jgi:hypothetical protein
VGLAAQGRRALDWGVASKPLSPDEEAFLEALLSEDELGVVVRAHIHIEARLNELVENLVLRPALLPRLRYEQRARLACALGLVEEIFQPLKILGDIRNQFSHKLDTKLTPAMVQALHDAIPDRNRGLGAYAKTRAKHPEMPADPASLPPKEKFIMCALMLQGVLKVGCEQALAKRKPK